MRRGGTRVKAVVGPVNRIVSRFYPQKRVQAPLTTDVRTAFSRKQAQRQPTGARPSIANDEAAVPLLPIIIALHASFATALPSRLRMESAVLAELNRARTDPVSYADSLRVYRGYYHDRVIIRPDSPNRYLTSEGVAPLDEAVDYVRSRERREPLAPATTLAAAAGDHQAEQQQDGAVGHAGPDGSSPADRVRRHGGGDYVGEVIAYGSDDAADVVRQLIIDDGVSDRGHRTLLFDDSLRYAGVSCGAHPVYRNMCVINVARTADGQPIRR